MAQIPASFCRWFTKKKLGYDVLERNICIPVHTGHNHWTLLTVNPSLRVIERLDSLLRPDSNNNIVRALTALP
jgi:Ulp1 family protease